MNNTNNKMQNSFGQWWTIYVQLYPGGKNTRKAWEKSGINSEASNLCLLWIKLNQKHIEIRLYCILVKSRRNGYYIVLKLKKILGKKFYKLLIKNLYIYLFSRIYFIESYCSKNTELRTITQILLNILHIFSKF